MKCPKCNKNPATTCLYGEYDRLGDFDCFAPEEIDTDCENCHHIWCYECQQKK